jgi:hypothetical protein
MRSPTKKKIRASADSNNKKTPANSRLSTSVNGTGKSRVEPLGLGSPEENNDDGDSDNDASWAPLDIDRLVWEHLGDMPRELAESECKPCTHGPLCPCGGHMIKRPPLTGQQRRKKEAANKTGKKKSDPAEKGKLVLCNRPSCFLCDHEKHWHTSEQMCEQNMAFCARHYADSPLTRVIPVSLAVNRYDELAEQLGIVEEDLLEEKKEESNKDSDPTCKEIFPDSLFSSTPTTMPSVSTPMNVVFTLKQNKKNDVPTPTPPSPPPPPPPPTPPPEYADPDTVPLAPPMTPPVNRGLLFGLPFPVLRPVGPPPAAPPLEHLNDGTIHGAELPVLRTYAPDYSGKGPDASYTRPVRQWAPAFKTDRRNVKPTRLVREEAETRAYMDAVVRRHEMNDALAAGIEIAEKRHVLLYVNHEFEESVVTGFGAWMKDRIAKFLPDFICTNRTVQEINPSSDLHLAEIEQCYELAGYARAWFGERYPWSEDKQPRARDVRRYGAQLFNQLRTAYTGQRKGEIFLDLAQRLLTDSKLWKARIAEKDGCMKEVIISRVKEIVSVDPNYATYAKDLGTLLNTHTYVLNQLFLRAGREKAAVPVINGKTAGGDVLFRLGGQCATSRRGDPCSV